MTRSSLGLGACLLLASLALPACASVAVDPGAPTSDAAGDTASDAALDTASDTGTHDSSLDAADTWDEGVDTAIDAPWDYDAPFDGPWDAGPGCPGALPTSGAACTGTLDCMYPSSCGSGGKDEAACVGGHWSLYKPSCDCPTSPPSWGADCGSPGMSCSYGSSYCGASSCVCGSDLKWSCAIADCPPPPPDGDAYPPPYADADPPPYADVGPPPVWDGDVFDVVPIDDAGYGGCADGVPCTPSTGCGSACGYPSPPGSYSTSCSCGSDGVFHCTKTPC